MTKTIIYRIFSAIMIVLLAFLTMPVDLVYAATCTSAAGGNWSNAATWSGCGGGTPGAGDDVIISANHTITVDVNSAANSVTINSATAANGITISGTNSLTVANAITMNAVTTNNITSSISVGTGTLSAASISIAGGTGNRVSELSLSTGAINVSGNITFSGTAGNARLTFTGAGTLNLQGNLGTGGTFAASTGTVNLNGAAQTFAGYTYSNLTIAGSSTKTPLAAFTVNDALTISSGATLDPVGFTHSLSSATLTVNGTLDFTNANGSITNSTGTSVLTMGSTGLIRTLDLNGLGPATNASLFNAGTAFTTTSIDTNGTVEYYRNTTSGQVVTDRDYNNLTITGSSQTKTWTLTGTRTVNGNVTINSGAPLTLSGAQTVNVKGNWSNSGTFTAGTSTIGFTGSTAQTISGSSATTFNNLTINNGNGVTLSGVDITVNTTLTFTNGKITTGANRVIFPTTATATGSPTSYINGNARRAFTNAALTFTFPIGDATNFAPAQIAFSAVSVNGNVDASVTNAACGSTGIDQTKNVNHCWTLTNGGVTFTNYSATFTFQGVGTDADAGSNTAAYIVGRNDGSWTYPTVGTRTATSTQATGITALGTSTFEVGEPSGPTITSATYDASTGALVVTGTNFQATAGAANDIVANKFTLTGEGSTTYTLTDTANVEIASSTSFTLVLSATDRAAVNQLLNKNGPSSTGGTTYNLAAADDWDAFVTAGDTSDATNGVTVSNVAVPTLTSATYDASTGALVVTGTGFLKSAGATNDIDVSKLSVTGEGGSTYTLTSAGVEITSGTSFTVILNATDIAAVNQILNKNGTSSTGGTIYNLAGAEDWNRGAEAAVVIADTTGNGITVSGVVVPAITSAAYNASTGVLVVTGTGLLKLSGATNDIDASMFTLTGEGSSTYTLTDTADVEITSGTQFTLTLSATDRAAVNLILNKNGPSSTGGTTYNLAGAENWNTGADSSVNIADASNGVMVSNVAVPSITSATYNAGTGVLVVTGTGLLQASGATNDIVANKFTFTGQAAGTYALTTTPNVEITSATSFTLTLSGVDRTAVNLLLNNNGTSALDATTYNLAAAEDWNAGADAAVVIADLTGNGITVSGVNAAPVLAAIEGAALAYNENQAATAITSTTTAADADSANLTGATIQITGNYQNGQDVLAFTNTVNITGTWTPATGTLALSGTDTVSNYQAAIRAVTYQNTSENPNTSTRTVSFTITDGTSNSNTVTRNITVTAVNDAPTGGNETVSTNEDTQKVFAAGDFTNYNDAEGNALASIEITSLETAGALKCSGVDVVVSDICAVGNLAFDPAANANGSPYATFGFKVNDGTVSSSASYTMTINVTAVNDAPVQAVAPNQFRIDGTTAIAQGSSTNETSVVIKATATDTEGQQYQLEVEVKNNAAAFDGTGTCLSPLTNSGAQASTGSCGSFAAGSYKWRYRFVDSGSAASAWTIFGGSDPDFIVDTGTPTVTNVTSPDGNGTYFAGNTINIITVTFSEVVYLSPGGCSPQLLLELGAVDGIATYTGGSGTITLTFTYTIVAGDVTPDLDYVDANSLALNNCASIQDAASNNANLTLPVSGSPGSLGANKAIIIDAVLLQVSSGGINSTPGTGDANISENEVVLTSLGAITQLFVQFNKDVNNPSGDSDPDDVTNPANYRLLYSATGNFATSGCGDSQGNPISIVLPDVEYQVSTVTYSNGGGTGPFIATLNLTTPLTVPGYYRLYVCGTTSIVQTNNTGLALAGNGSNGTDFTRNFQIQTSAVVGGGGGGGNRNSTTTLNVSALPATGFTPNRVTILPEQPEELAYTDLGDLWIEIPALGVKSSIVGVPMLEEGEWDVTWLSNSVGWLDGTAFPSWEGNSVMTAHVTNASGLDGPFANLKKLKYGDQIIVHAFEQQYIFEVRNSRVTKPFSTSFAFEHLEDQSYLTLITCQVYLPKSDTYMYRRVIRAVLVKVQDE